MREDTGKIVRKYFGFTQVINDDFFTSLSVIRRSPIPEFVFDLLFTYFQNFLGLDLDNFATLVCSSLYSLHADRLPA